MASKVKSALAHAEAGWPILPLHYAVGKKCSCGKKDCKSPGKHPHSKNGVGDATTDPEQIKKWWKKWPDANIGGRLDGLVCIDADIGTRRRGGKPVEVHGDKQLLKLEREYGSLQRVLVQNTGSGSQHILFKKPKGADYPAKLARDIDIKSGDRAYIVLHGSNHVSGSDYEWRGGLDAMPLRLEVLPTAPDWFENAWKARDQRDSEDRGDSEDNDITSTDAHNRQHFESFDELEDAVLATENDKRFESRDEWINFLAAIHFESGGSEDGRELAHEWSEKWHGGDDAEETDHVWDSLGKRSNRKLKTGRTIARLAMEDGWTPWVDQEADDDDEDDDAVTKAVKRLNKKHARVILGSQTRYLYEFPNGRIEFMRRNDFLAWHESTPIAHETKKKNAKGKWVKTDIVKSAGQWWIADPRSRKFQGVTLSPNSEPKNEFNLWRGFAYKPSSAGSCDIFLDHILRNVCGGDKKLYRWLIGWMAHCVQRPQEKPGVALAFKGKRGVGKSIISYTLGKLFHRSHVTKASRSSHLTGNFNAHLERAIIVRVEEAFWVGDKAAGNVLKDMVTDETINIERKGVDVVEVPSFHRFIFTSNEQWVVPAGNEERRYACFNVSDNNIQDRKFFGRMKAQLRDGGYAALLDYLMEFDLDGIDVGRAPMTEALAEQKLASLEGVEGWWAELLFEGIPPGDFDTEAEKWANESLTVDCKSLRDAYAVWARTQRFQRPLSAPLFSQKLAELCPSMRTPRPRKKGVPTRCHRFPSLDVCREEFEKYLGQPVFSIGD